MEEEIVFVTTALYTKWLDYQKNIVKKLFPKSQHIIVDGRKNWPSSWFYWIDEIKNIDKKYYIHIDEDFFITNKKEVLKSIELMENNNIDILGCSDGYHHFRQHNPVALNSFYMVGKIKHLKDLNFNGIKFKWHNNSWINNYNIQYKEEYKKDFNYKHKKFRDCKFDDFEPYYAFMWKMKEMGLKFDYLYPHFDERFKSTNPRIDENSEDIGIHMWYVRRWYSNVDILGMTNKDRYDQIEKYLKNYN